MKKLSEVTSNETSLDKLQKAARILQKEIRKLRVQSARATIAQNKLKTVYVLKLSSAIDYQLSLKTIDTQELDDILDLIEVQFLKKR